jgi:hypothetical protein
MACARSRSFRAAAVLGLDVDSLVGDAAYDVLLAAIDRGVVDWPELVGSTARSQVDSSRGICMVVHTRCSLADHWYLTLRAEDGALYEELARTFCRRYTDLALTPALSAKVVAGADLNAGSCGTPAARENRSPAEDCADLLLVNPRLQSARRRVVEARGLTELVHFTWVENLPSILRSGILPRATLEGLANRPRFVDAARHDRRKYCSCLSITLPNYRMLSKMHKGRTVAKRLWAVLVISPEVLVTHRCGFYQRNAALHEYEGERTEYRSTANHLEAMFADEVAGRLRAHLNLRPNLTTDPEAEVLVVGPISPRYIERVLVCDEHALETVQMQDLPCETAVCPALFARRADHRAWESDELAELLVPGGDS